MRKTIRNIFIFVFVALSCGWFGVFADKNMPPQPVGNSLGMGIWLVFPLLSTIILRFFEKDGWTVRTVDRLPSAHFEHTVAIRQGKADILSSFSKIEQVLGEKAI